MSKEDPDVQKMIEDAIEVRLAERDKSNKNKSELEQLSGKIDKALAKRTKSGNGESEVHEHDAPNASKDHVHATHSNDEFCPTCNEKNPAYNADQAICSDCGEPVGTVAEIEKGDVTTCRNCGAHEAEHKSKGYTL